MKRMILTLLFLLVCGPAHPAELLVRAKGHWMDSFTQEQVDKMREDELAAYKARAQKGDIVVVRPDGWAWGKEEQLPNYIVVKVPDLPIKEAVLLEGPLVDEYTDEYGELKQRVVRVCKNKFDEEEVEGAKISSLSAIQINAVAADLYIDEKTGEETEIVPVRADVISALKYKLRPGIKLLNVAYNFWVRQAYAASQRKKYIAQSGGDYTSLNAAVTGEADDLISADVYLDLEITGTWSAVDTSRPSFAGYTLDATHYVSIYATGDARHSGVWKSDGYILYNQTFASHIGTAPNTRWSGLQFKEKYASNAMTAIDISSAGGEQYIYNNIFTSDSGTRQKAISHGNISGYVYIANNIIYGMNYGIWTNSGNQAINIFNNTIVGCTTTGILTNPSSVVKNNLVTGCGTDYALTTGTWGTTATNISSDTSSPETSLRSKSLVYNNAAGNDYHLSSSDTVAIDAGTDLGTTGLSNIDIDGRDRDAEGDTWDIGADEYVSAGGGGRTRRFF